MRDKREDVIAYQRKWRIGDNDVSLVKELEALGAVVATVPLKPLDRVLTVPEQLGNILHLDTTVTGRVMDRCDDSLVGGASLFIGSIAE